MTGAASEPAAAIPAGLAAHRAAQGLVVLLGARLAGAAATLLGATALLLALLVLAPGDPLPLLPDGGEAAQAQLRAQFGLNQPVPVRWATHLGRLLVGDLGTSYAYRTGAPVAEVLAVPATRTVGLVGSAALLVVAWGTALAFLTAALRERGGASSSLRVTVQAVSLLPTFLLAHVAVTELNALVWAGMEQGWWSRPGWFALPDEASAVRTSLAVVVLAVGSSALSEVHAEVEDALVRLRSSPWVDAARARGAATWPLVARGLVPPVAATLASRVAVLLGGAVVVEKMLLLNGAGAVLWEAARLRDYELALSIAVLGAAVVAGTRLAADLVRLLADPRLREAR